MEVGAANGFPEAKMKSPLQNPAIRFARRTAVPLIFAFCVAFGAGTIAQDATANKQIPATQNPANQAPVGDATPAASDPEQELQLGTALTRQGSFSEAIPHLVAARGRVTNEYAASFNLALCYLGTDQYKHAIEVLNAVRESGHDGADVENLLAQAYIGNSQPDDALAALEKAADISPQSEKLYAFVADACADHRQYRLGLKVVAVGLHNLPQSARLHYERAIFLTQLDALDQAKQDFALAAKLAPGSEIATLASAHEHLLTGDVEETIRIAREGVKQGFDNPGLLTILGEALIRSGVRPGEPDFNEARTVLDKAVTKQPEDFASQIALGTLDLTAGQLETSIQHLQKASELDPGSPAVYANLAKAYQRRGDAQLAQDALKTLQKLNQQQADRINSAPGDRKLGYASQNLAGQDVTPEKH